MNEFDGLRDGCQNVDVSVEQGRGAGMTLKRALPAYQPTEVEYAIMWSERHGYVSPRKEKE